MEIISGDCQRYTYYCNEGEIDGSKRRNVIQSGKLQGGTRVDLLKGLLLEDDDLLSLNPDDFPIT